MYDYAVFFIIAQAWFFFWYFVPNGFFYWLFWRHEWFDNQRIQSDRRPRPGQIKTEILRSVWCLTLYAVVATFCYGCYRNGYSMVDWNLSGIGEIIISLLVLNILFDTWFYWVHRFLHLKPIYIRFHKQHHESITPTPWATYSFSSFEAIANCPLWVLFFTFPAHPLAIIIGLFLQNIYNTFGHLGYEFFPKWMLRNKYICAVQATPTHHDAHHRYVQGNFGHYYNIWDILMKTELRQYKPLRESVYEQLPNSPTAKPGGQPQSTDPT